MWCQQKWYFTNVYESIIYNEDANLPIFKRLKNTVDNVFDKAEDTYLENTIFNDNKDYYEKLKKLHARKVEIQRLKELSSLSKPFVIEFSGTPRTGKTTTINNLYDFFKKGGFKVTLVEEFTTSKYYKEVFFPQYKSANMLELNMAIIKKTTKQLESAIKLDTDIILIDRSINDRQIWNYRRYLRKDIDEKTYLEAKEKYSKISSKLIDFLVITYADVIVSLKRDYNSSLALEKRTFLNTENINEYNNSLNALQELFNNSVKNFILLDTSYMNMDDVSIDIAEKIMIAMRQKYIDSFKEKYNLKWKSEAQKLFQFFVFTNLYCNKDFASCF